jgi:hypothetical protein
VDREELFGLFHRDKLDRTPHPPRPPYSQYVFNHYHGREHKKEMDIWETTAYRQIPRERFTEDFCNQFFYLTGSGYRSLSDYYSLAEKIEIVHRQLWHLTTSDPMYDSTRSSDKQSRRPFYNCNFEERVREKLARKVPLQV